MAKIPEEVLDRLRNAVDIADVIGQDVQLKKQGKNLMGHCPFHQDDTPSFSVNQEKQFFYCFSCHRSGNVFSFLMQLHDMSFPQAVEAVAEFADLELPSQYTAAAPSNPNSQGGQLGRLHEQAAKLYHHILVNTPAGQPALKYLLDRGMTRELIDQFNLGFAPEPTNGQPVLYQYAQQQELDYQLLRKSGLFVERADGQLQDRFHGRVMYPIKNANGQVIAFSGRILAKKAPANTPKYLNSPETPLFNKRQTLFNLDLAKQAARKAGHLTLFEGFMDVIAAYGAGIKTGIASMGTSFTSEQVQAIARLTSQLTIAYDGDEPGQAAIDRSLKLVEDTAPDLTLRVVQLPAGLDPDEYVQKYGNLKFQEYMTHGEETAVDFRLAYLRKDLNLQKQSELINYLNAALEVIATVPTPVGQSVYLKKLAGEFGLDLGSLERQLASIPAPRAVPAAPMGTVPPPEEEAGLVPPPAENPDWTVPAANQPTTLSRGERAAQILLKYYCYDAEVRYRLDALADFQFPQPAYQQLYTVIKHYLADHSDFVPAAVMDHLTPGAQSLLSQVETQIIAEEEKAQVVTDCLRVLTTELPLTAQIEQTQAALNEASMLGDSDQILHLTTQLVQLYQRQQAMKTEEIN